MSNRTLLEINHDYAGTIDAESMDFMTALLEHLYGGSPKLRELFPGVEFLGIRHHSESYSIKWGAYSGGYRGDELNRRIRLEQQACAGLSDEQLSQDPIAKAREALMECRAIARLEQGCPTEMRATAFALIEKRANAALALLGDKP